MTQPPDQPRPARRDLQGVPIFGILVLGIGVLLLLQTTGVVTWRIWAEIWRFWPLLLIAIGVNLILGRRFPVVAGAVVLLLVAGAIAGAAALAVGPQPGVVTSSYQAPLEDTATVNVTIGFGAGTLRIDSLAGDSPHLVEGQFDTPGREAAVTLGRAETAADLNIGMEGRTFFPGRLTGAEWVITLARAPDVRMTVNGGAADMQIDLRELQVSRLQLSVGAASVNLQLPAQAGQTDLTVESGASSIDIRVPEGVSARITSRSGLSSVEVDTGRFPRVNDRWESPDYETAEHRVAIDLRVGAASVNVR